MSLRKIGAELDVARNTVRKYFRQPPEPPLPTPVRERKHQQLRPWMEKASKSGFPEVKSFVVGIERDYDAVREALRQPWSQGPTEGKINKLKTIKRVMYGRAGFPLLR